MNMIARKQTAPVDGAAVLAVLERRLGEVQARRADVTALIIELEKTTAATRDDGHFDLERAEALLEGDKFVASREKPISQLAALHAERTVIDKALQIGRSRQHRLAVERAGEIWAANFADIAEIEKRRVMLAIELQNTNAKREALREKLTAAGGAGVLSTDGVDLLGFTHLYDEVNWAAERLIADGVISRREIEKAKFNG
jgi:hypothetical protein